MLTAKHPFITASKALEEICKPLLSFDIHHFTYLKQYDDGGRLGISNKPQWIADYYNMNLFQSSLFEEKPSTYQAKSDIWIGDYDLEVYHHGKLYYNTGHSISITEPRKDACDFFLFATTPYNSKAINFLAGNMDILYHFITYFKDRACSALKKIHSNKLIIQPIRQSNNVKQMSPYNAYYQSMHERKKLFYKTTPIYKYTFESDGFAGVKISQRELDCIVYLLDNKTAAETAILMNVSRRTVEQYLENIKIKLDCSTKSELYTKLVTNKSLQSIRCKT